MTSNDNAQPELPIDPPSTIDDTPVDHLAVAKRLLLDCRCELDQANIPPLKRSLLNVFAGALQAEIDMLR